jgi:L-lactate utilization protein LutB
MEATIFVPPLPTNILDLKHRITKVVVPFVKDMLVNICKEVEYWINMYCVTCGAHMCVCNVCEKLGKTVH